MYGCESWTIKKVERRRIDVFELWCWRRLLRVPWTARRSNLSILKEISPEYSLEGLMLKLKLQYFGLLMQRTDSLEKTLMLGKSESRERLKALKWISPKSWESRRYFWFLSFPLSLYSIHQQVELCLPPRYNLNLSASPQLHCCHPDPTSTISAVLCCT